MYGLKFFLQLHKENIKYDYLVRKLEGVNYKTTISSWIKRENIPNPKHIEVLAKEFNTKEEYINRILTDEEMKRLEFEFMYKCHDWQEVTYIDDDGYERTELLWGETDESKYAEEEFYNEQADEIVLKEAKSFLASLCTTSESQSARTLISQVISMSSDEKTMDLLSNILNSVEGTLKKNPTVLDKINFEVKIPNEFIEHLKENSKTKNVWFTQDDGSSVTIKDGVKTIHK